MPGMLSIGLGPGNACRRLAEQQLLALFRHGWLGGEWLSLGVSPGCGRAFAHGVKPAAKIGEFVEILLLTLPGHDPGIAGHVGDGIVLTGDAAAAGKPAHAVEAIG